MFQELDHHSFRQSFLQVAKGENRADRIASYISHSDGVRPDRDRVVDQTRQEALKRLRQFAFFNVEYGQDGRPLSNININSRPEILRELQSSLREAASRGKVKMIFPFVDEVVAPNNVRYGIDLVGEQHVLAVKAPVGDPEKGNRAIQRIREFGGSVVFQSDVLNSIDWHRLRLLYRIYPRRYPDEAGEMYKLRVKSVLPSMLEGSKGLTMFAGVLELYRRDLIARKRKEDGLEFNEDDILDDDAWIIFHDTDITNPEEYRALEHLAFVLAYEQQQGGQQQFRSAQIARGGAGRNNEAIINAFNALANKKNEYSKMLGIALQSLMWPLTGERMMRWGEIKRMPWTNRMGIESWWNIWNASLDIRDGYDRRVAQIGNPNPKNEEGESFPEREFSMIFMLGLFIQDVGRFSARIQRYPHEWGDEEIRWFNRAIGGKLVSVATHDNAIINDVHAPMTDVSKPYDYLLPSIAMMNKNNLLFWR